MAGPVTAEDKDEGCIRMLSHLPSRRLPGAGRGRGPGAAGFTLVEMVVAMLVISVGLLGLMTVQMRSIATVGLAGQREDATALGNRTMEQMRALPYGTVTGGMVCSDLNNSDLNISVSTVSGRCSATFHPLYDSSINGEAIKTTTGALQVAPLNPHIQPMGAGAAGTTVGNVQYDVRAYITLVNADVTVNAGYWLTVIVSWKSAASGNTTKTIGTRSQLFSPIGCLATTTHPFSGPCQAFHYSDAGATPASIVVQSSRSGQGIIDGVDVLSASSVLANSSARVQSEQTVSAQSDVTPSAVKVVSSTATTTGGGTAAVSAADTDPATGVSNSPAAAAPASQTGPTSLSANGGGSQFSISDGDTDTGTTYSTTAAAASPACSDSAGALLTTGQACSTSTATQASSGPPTASLTLNSLGARRLTLADAAAASAPSRAFGARFVTGGGSHCTGTSGVGCIAAGTTRTLGVAHAGGLAQVNSGDRIDNTSGSTPTDVTGAVGTNSLVAVSGYTDQAVAESGVGAGSSNGARTGTLTYWTGSGFSNLNLATAVAGTYPVSQVTGTYGTTTVTVAGSVAITAAGAPSSKASPCQPTACGVKATGGSAVVRLTYLVTSNGTQIGAFTVTLDVGSALAQTTYKAAPSA